MPHGCGRGHRFFAFNGSNDEDFLESLIGREPGLVTGIADLRGKRLLISRATGADAFVSLFLRRERRIPGRDVTILRAAPSRFADMLRNGQADAVFALEPHGSHLARHHGFPVVERNLIGRRLFGDGGTHVFLGGAMVNGMSIARHRAEMRRIATIWRDAQILVREDPSKRLSALQTLYPNIPPVITAPLPRTVLVRKLSGMTFQQLQTGFFQAFSLGILPRAIDVTSVAVAL